MDIIYEHYPGKKYYSQYTKDFPKNIYTSLKKIALSYEKEINKCRKNIDYLPL